LYCASVIFSRRAEQKRIDQKIKKKQKNQKKKLHDNKKKKKLVYVFDELAHNGTRVGQRDVVDFVWIEPTIVSRDAIVSSCVAHDSFAFSSQ
jgi:hypothetical protein